MPCADAMCVRTVGPEEPVEYFLHYDRVQLDELRQRINHLFLQRSKRSFNYKYNFTECVMKCRGSDFSNCIGADVIRDMLNVVEFGRHDSRPTAGLNTHGAQELMNDLCSN